MTSPEALLTAAEATREHAYAPYSGFSVGAALLAKDGRVFVGCNVENASFSPTVCAERVAIFSAVAAGVTEFSAIAVVGGKTGSASAYCPPCGVCRQVLSEFAGDDFPVYLKGESGAVTVTLSRLLPERFGENHVKGDGQ